MFYASDFYNEKKVMEHHMEKLETAQLIEKYRKIVQIGATIGLILTALIAYWVATGTYFKPIEEGGQFAIHLKQSGVLGPVIFVLIQIVQVIFPVIPGGAVSVSGTAVFGYIWGFVYNFIGITIGSIIAFFLARRYGEFFVKCFISDESFEKYFGWTKNENRFAWILAILFTLPAAPDDILCMIAGMTTMRFKKFILIFIPTKAISTFVFTWMMQEMILLIVQYVWPWIVQNVSPFLINHWLVALISVISVIIGIVYIMKHLRK